MIKHVASLPVAAIAAVAMVAFSAVGSVASAQDGARVAPGAWTGLYNSVGGMQSPDNYSNKLELRYPELARRYGSDPLSWPAQAFRGIDCDSATAGCPTTETVGGP